MRNDVKLGFAIGGVLLAVLIVYVLVVPGGTQAKKVSQGAGNSTVARTDAGKTTPAGAEKVSLEPVQSGSATTSPAVPPPLPETAEKTDPFETKSAPEPVAQAQTPAGQTSNNDLDWNKLLNDQPVLMIDTPVKTGGKPATPAVSAPTPSPVAQAPAPTATPAQTPSQQLIQTSPAPVSPTAETTTVAPTSIAPVPPTSVARTHKVQQGETLSSISTAQYGNPNQYPAILKANPGLDPTRLKIGQTINLPDLATLPKGDAVAQPAAGRVEPQIDAAKQYRVAPGDSLHKISQKLYGDITHAEKIFELNASTMGNDRHKLKVGQVIQLPEPPTVAAASTTTAQ